MAGQQQGRRGGPRSRNLYARLEGPVTVLILPGERIGGRIPILDPSLRGIIVPVERGSIAIVGEPGEALDAVERRILGAMRRGAREEPNVASGHGRGGRGGRYA